VFGVTVWVSAMAFVFSILLKQRLPDFFPFVVTGMLTWTIYTNMANEGCATYLSSADLIRGMPLNPWFYIARTFTKNAYIGIHYLFVAVAINLCFGVVPHLPALALSIPLTSLLLVEIISIQAYLNARFRDVAPLTGMLLQIVPLVSAIAWSPDMLGPYRYLADYNPFFQVVQLVRQPLLGDVPSLTTYAWCVAYIAILGVASIWSVRRATRDVFYLL
jgi:lipopolysaccharide transport system permease protein